MKRVHVHVSGKVQGVFFRATTREEAVERDVNGWVRNLPDGRVEAVFEGELEKVNRMVDFCHEGSPAADVENVEIEEEKPQGLENFEIRR